MLASVRLFARRNARRGPYFIEHYDSNGTLVFLTHGLSYKQALWVIGGFLGVGMETLDVQLQWLAPDDHAGIGWLLTPKFRGPGALTVVFRGPFPPYHSPKANERPPPLEVQASTESGGFAGRCTLQSWPPGPDAPPTADIPPELSPAGLADLERELRKPASPLTE
jgi:hypothetical protein